MTVFVANEGSDTVTPIRAATRRAGAPIRTGSRPSAVAITPNGKAVYVTNYGTDTVTPIRAATRRAGAPITVGINPWEWRSRRTAGPST